MIATQMPPVPVVRSLYREIVRTLGGNVRLSASIDCTNAIVGSGPSLMYGHNTSAAEETAKKLPSARFYKAFNAQGAENLADPIYDGVPATGFFCGDDDQARAVVAQLITEVGFEALDVGPLKNARLLEPMPLLWFAAASALGSRQIAFRVMRR